MYPKTKLAIIGADSTAFHMYVLILTPDSI